MIISGRNARGIITHTHAYKRKEWKEGKKGGGEKGRKGGKGGGEGEVNEVEDRLKLLNYSDFFCVYIFPLFCCSYFVSRSPFHSIHFRYHLSE